MKKAPAQTLLQAKKVLESQNLHQVGISLWKQEWLNQITRLSGTLAIGNEYQVHYWSLVLRKQFNDGSIKDVSIPLVIYNYPQEVTSVTIDFKGSDMIQMSETTVQLAGQKATELLSKLPEDFKNKFDEFLLVPYMTLHRHP